MGFKMATIKTWHLSQKRYNRDFLEYRFSGLKPFKVSTNKCKNRKVRVTEYI